MQLTNLQSLAVGDFDPSFESARDYSHHECQWKRLEFAYDNIRVENGVDYEERCGKTDVKYGEIVFKHLSKLPLREVKEVYLDCSMFDQVTIRLPNPAREDVVAAVCRTAADLLRAGNLKIEWRRINCKGLVMPQSVCWQMDGDNTEGEAASAMFAAVATLIKPRPALMLQSYYRALLPAVLDWAATSVFTVIAYDDDLLKPGFVHMLQKLQRLKTILACIPFDARFNTDSWSGFMETFRQVAGTVARDLVAPMQRPYMLQLKARTFGCPRRETFYECLDKLRQELHPAVNLNNLERRKGDETDLWCATLVPSSYTAAAPQEITRKKLWKYNEN